MSEYEPLRIRIDRFVGKKAALKELVEKLVVRLDNCKTDRFLLKLSIIEQKPLKPEQEKLIEGINEKLRQK